MKTRFLFLVSLFSQLVYCVNYYVSPNGDATGECWSSTTSLHNALNLALANDTIFLLEGTYTPSQRVTNGKTEKENCFEIKNNVTLIGGYASNDYSHNPLRFPTRLSGRINESTTAYHTVVITAPTQTNKKVSLIGLVIQDGKANNTRRTTINNYIYPQNCGAAIIIVNGAIHLSHCTFENNSATLGGAVYAENCTFTCEKSSYKTNTASESGGALLLKEVLFSITESELIHNSSSGEGDNLVASLAEGVINTSELVSLGKKYSIVLDSTTCYMYNSSLSNSNQAEVGLMQSKNGSFIFLTNSMAYSQASNIDMFLFSGGKTHMMSCSLVGDNNITSTNNNQLYVFNSLAGVINKSEHISQSIVNGGYYNPQGSYTPLDITNNTITEIPVRDNGFTSYAPLNTAFSNPAITNAITLKKWLSIASKYSLPGFALTFDQRFQHRDTTAIFIGSYQPETPISEKTNQFWHVLIYGQSLAEGYQSYPPISNFSLKNNYMLGHNVCSNNKNKHLTQLSPLFSTATLSDVEAGYSKQIANSAKCENAITGMANHLRSLDTELPPIIATSCATGGRTIEQLSKHCQRSPYYYNDFLSAIEMGKSVATNNEAEIEMPAIIWMQGESNYTPNYPGLITATDNTTDKNEYKALLIKLKNDMQEEVCHKYNQINKPLFITYQVGGKYIRGEEQAIAMAQLEAANEYEDIICAGPVYAMSDYGAGHLDANGYRWYGEMLAKVFQQTAIEKKPFQPLQPIKLSRLDKKSIEIQFYVPVPPLAFDTLTVAKEPDYGFVLSDNTGVKTIHKISCTPSTVIISCVDDIMGDVSLAYAGLNTLGHGNLRDSDTYPAKFNYVDLDEKLNDGSYKYEREENLSLHPRYEPKDTDGVIYNKPYPLYNFSMHYYYKLPSGTTELDLINQSVNTVSPQTNTPIVVVKNNWLYINGEWDKAHVYSVSGMKLMSFNQGNPTDISPLSLGIYICLLESNNSTLSLTFIK